MNKIWSFVFSLICLQSFAQADLDVLNYSFQIELNDQNDTILGRAEIQIKSLSDTKQLILDIADIKQSGKGMRILKLEGTGIASHTHANEKLIIQYNQTIRKNDTVQCIIAYKGVPADGLIISKNKFGKRTFFADNWPNRGHNWIPCHDVPGDKSPVEFKVIAPAHYQVVANGIQIEETNLPDNKRLTHYKEAVPLSTKVMVIGVADFAVNLSGHVNGCIPVYSWVYPENKDNGFYDYALAKEILEWYIKNVGEYGYKKLANVQSKTKFGGLENANTIFYNENSIDGKRHSEDLLAHEIAHQWFGNMATEKEFAHLWLSEGFATYFTILYLEEKYGVKKAHEELKKDKNQIKSASSRSPVVDTTSNYMSLLNANSYQKGSWILHMLRSQLGNEVFWKSIRKYYSLYAGKTATTADLQKVFEEVSGKNLSRFFKQWLYTVGNPTIAGTWEYDENSKRLILQTEQKQPGEAFELPLEIGIKDAEGKIAVEQINITKKQETFTIKCAKKPAGIEVDPYLKTLVFGSISVK